MSEQLIQWPEAQYWDRPYNPIVGCCPISPACDNCYAREAMVNRFGQSFVPHRTKKRAVPKMGVVFVGNMCDMFGEWRDMADVENDIAEVAIAGGDAKYLWCTKRVDVMKRALDAVYDKLDNPKGRFERQWFGFTAENQEWFNKRVEVASGIPFHFNQWLSAEPLLGPIDMGDMVGMFKWVAVGCESGPNRRPCEMEWIEGIVDQCRKANVPVFVKQLCMDSECVRDINRFPKHLRIRQVPWGIDNGKD